MKITKVQMQQIQTQPIMTDISIIDESSSLVCLFVVGTLGDIDGSETAADNPGALVGVAVVMTNEDDTDGLFEVDRIISVLYV